jgi:hypothetical protein
MDDWVIIAGSEKPKRITDLQSRSRKRPVRSVLDHEGHGREIDPTAEVTRAGHLGLGPVYGRSIPIDGGELGGAGVENRIKSRDFKARQHLAVRRHADLPPGCIRAKESCIAARSYETLNVIPHFPGPILMVTDEQYKLVVRKSRSGEMQIAVGTNVERDALPHQPLDRRDFETLWHVAKRIPKRALKR